MTTLLVARQYLKLFYSKYEVFITPFLKFVLALVSLIAINSYLGYMSVLTKAPLVIIVALMCSFMPLNFIVVVAALFVLLHLYVFSLECVAVAFVVFLLLFLLYFRFSPKDTIAVLLTPLCFWLKIPYVMPLAMGLVGTPVSAISVGCGTVVYYMLHYIKTNATVLSSMDDLETAARFRLVIDGLLNNREMYVTVIAFAITLILVYLIRRLKVDYAWTIAMIAGAVVDVALILIGDLLFETYIAIGWAILGSIISLVLVAILQFFVFHVDYTRTENVQFEDDEYYYYVKAVPKVSVTTPEKKVKKINTRVR